LLGGQHEELVTDWGKFNAVACLLDSATNQREFETIAT
jgi:hypothetical protein